MPCPPRLFIKHLRSVGDQFALRDVDTDSIVDDVVDFIASAIPDVMVECMLDAIATALGALSSVPAFDDLQCLDSMCQAINVYSPYDNPFLEQSTGQHICE